MITVQELNALVELAQRAHKSSAEAMWLAALLRKFNAPAPQPEAEKEETEDDDEPAT